MGGMNEAMIKDENKVNLNKETIFQVSTVDALLGGALDGLISIKELKTKGDFGIGSITGLEGAIAIIDGKWYHCKEDCRVFPIDDVMMSPKFMTSFFKVDQSIRIDSKLDYEGIKDYIKSLLPTQNIMYAAKIEGTFDYIKFKVYPKQNKPYAVGTVIAASKVERVMENVKGTLVGYIMPEHLLDIASVQYHFHFISEDKKYGGHLIDFQLSSGTVYLDYKHNLQLVVPNSSDYYKSDLTGMTEVLNEVANIVNN